MTPDEVAWLEKHCVGTIRFRQKGKRMTHQLDPSSDWRIDAEILRYAGEGIRSMAERLVNDGHLDARQHLGRIEEHIARLSPIVKRMKGVAGV